MADDKRPENPFGFKRIGEYDDGELDLAVKLAKERCEAVDLDFYTVLRGVDAHMEKRRRKQAAAATGQQIGGRHGSRRDVGSP